MTNKYTNMDIYALEDMDDVYKIIDEELEKLESESDYIVLYAKRNLLNELFTDLICDDFTLGYVNFDMVDDKLEDSLYLMLIRGDYVVSIEPAYSYKKDIMTHDAKSAIIYMDDCEQDIIDYCVESDKNVILFDFEDDDTWLEPVNEYDECSCCKCESHKNEKPATTSSTKSTYKINNKEVSKEEFDKKYEELEEMYLDNIRDMLLSYCEFMDEVNEWRKLIRW